MSLATAATTATAKWPRRGMLLAVLVVSLVLNVFFIAGAAWTRIEAPPAGLEQRFERMAAELKLDAKQRNGFERYAAATRARGENMRKQVGPLIGAAWEEIAKPQPDTAQVLRLFDQAIAKRQELQREAAVQTLDFLSILTPEQRGKFVAITRERRGAWRSQNR